MMPWIRALAVWLLIMIAESIHGVLRQFLVVPLIGDLRARQVGVLTGTAIVFLVAWLLIRWVNTPDRRLLLGIGVLWVALTIVFEIVLGRLLGLEWNRIFADYDLGHGGLMGLGLAAMLFMPLIVAKLRQT